ncbi:hypothetical protein KP509_16G016200 [Ceratopteris richardii]|uniref:GH10 domain-containing protein n=1 Tax=Ceratopteris richardii TaxID=49495 RepID=A0A8T2SWY8_CERRI|nr:hypothetical protein KP509_16G016200 [Ceratopteris richardii]
MLYVSHPAYICFMCSDSTMDMDLNIVFNPNFKLGLRGWQSNSCKAHISSVNAEDGFSTGTGKQMVCVVTDRKENWQGLEQDLAPRIKQNVTYRVSVTVKISNSIAKEDVKATLRLENPGSQTKYVPVGKITASSSSWSTIKGEFFFDVIPKRAVFYIEGPRPGVDLVIKDIDIRSSTSSKSREAPVETSNIEGCSLHENTGLIRNPDFKQGLEFWYGKGCKVELLDPSSVEMNGLSKQAVLVTKRTSSWQGLEQNVTGRIQGKRKYEVSACVRIDGDTCAEVLATLWTKDKHGKDHFINLGRVMATSSGWVNLKGIILLNETPAAATAYIEGPRGGVDILVNHFSIFAAKKLTSEKPVIDRPEFGVNIVENSGFSNGLIGWSSLGNCSLRLNSGAPLILPNAARDSLMFPSSPTGIYVIAEDRNDYWEGPSQNITESIKAFVTYQVSAWVRVGNSGTGLQKVNVVLGVDGQWVNGGEVEGDPNTWKEIVGSFRFEKKPENVLLYVQGPSAHVDLMVSNLVVFAVDRPARFPILKMQTEKFRKRDVMIRVMDKNGHPRPLVSVTIKQKINTFPLGSCINSYSTKNDAYMKFFLENFNWAVFENELKWYWTEKECGNLNYQEADELCKLCAQHGICMRGHCIFWERDDAVQDWLKELSQNKLAESVQNRLIGLVSRFQGKFHHYDVNNEMLHGSFYRTRLGEQIIPYMFQLAQQLDPSVKLFVNDYHVIDGCDAHSSPEKYLEQIRMLQNMGAPVGGIGVQGHITYPVGTIIANALDKLAMAGLPIWITELDVESPNEFLRSEDLEVVLREAYAHPAVEGCILWGFMETAMYRLNSHLVDADGTVNEAGKSLLALKQEWLTETDGKSDERGCFEFRGYHGIYTVTVEDSRGNSVTKEFEVCKGENVHYVDLKM